MYLCYARPGCLFSRLPPFVMVYGQGANSHWCFQKKLAAWLRVGFGGLGVWGGWGLCALFIPRIQFSSRSAGRKGIRVMEYLNGQVMGLLWVFSASKSWAPSLILSSK